MTASAILGLFISFVLPTNPGQGRCGGVPSPVYCHAFSFTRGCSIIIGYNNYDVARLCSPRNGLARVSFRVTSTCHFFYHCSWQHYLLSFFIQK